MNEVAGDKDHRQLVHNVSFHLRPHADLIPRTQLLRAIRIGAQRYKNLRIPVFVRAVSGHFRR